MATSYTPNTRLAKPAWHDRRYDVVVGGNFDLLDAMTALGGLCVTPAEIPSASLDVAVAAGSFLCNNGMVVAFGGATVAIPASVTRYLWLTDAGALFQGAAWPAGATPHVRLAIVTTDASTVTAIADARVSLATSGPAALPIVTVTSAYAISDADGTVFANASGGAFSVTLPTAAGRAGRAFIVKRTSASNNVTVAGTIDGATNYVLTAQGAAVTVQSDGANWQIIAKV